MGAKSPSQQNVDVRHEGGSDSLSAKYFYLFFNEYFYLFFRNILNFLFWCGKYISHVPVESDMFSWRIPELAWQKGIEIQLHPLRAEAKANIESAMEKLVVIVLAWLKGIRIQGHPLMAGAYQK
jgi:hypothetical protein